MLCVVPKYSNIIYKDKLLLAFLIFYIFFVLFCWLDNLICTKNLLKNMMKGTISIRMWIHGQFLNLPLYFSIIF